jgi:DNA-directed RNA polymerase specialized sigma24 family protein
MVANSARPITDLVPGYRSRLSICQRQPNSVFPPPAAPPYKTRFALLSLDKASMASSCFGNHIAANVPLAPVTRQECLTIIYPRLRIAAKRIHHGSDDAEDKLNDVCLQVCESKSPNVPTVPDQLFAYCLIKLKFNSAFQGKYLRWSQMRSELNGQVNQMDRTDYSGKYDAEVIDRAVDRLPELHRLVFLLYTFDDFSYRQLAKETRIDKKMLYVIVNESKQMLRQHIRIE